MDEKVNLQITEQGSKESAKNVGSLADELGRLDKAQEQLDKNTKGRDLLKTGVLVAGVKQASQKIIEFSKKSADYIETLNVLDVAFSNNTDSIKKFTNAISETLNLDDATLIRSASRFKTLANSMSIAEEAGTNFSKMLTQMTLDVSSLYNMDFDKAEQALQYAVMGRGTTLKQRTGVSVLETTVQTTLDTLGVDAYVEDMNDTEKALARVISMSYQLRNSQGDLARTIEAPANQFRVLGEQVALAGRNIGNIFLPAVAAILPYVNAALIVINKLLSAIAKLFGFSETAWDFFGDSDALIDTFDDVGASIGGVGDKAAGSAKKLQQGLRAFDKLNNITTPTAGGGGGGGGAGGGTGINPNLLKAFNDIFGKYNDSLDGIKTKATQIAEAFMEWAKVLEPLKKPLKEIAELTYDGLVYVWKEVLKPLGIWIANSLIPELAKTTAEALELIYQIGLKLKPIYKTLFESIIKPFAQVLGRTLINTLKDLAKFLDAISKSKFLTTILAWGVAFTQFKTVLSLTTKLLGKSAFGKTVLEAASAIKNAGSAQDKWLTFLTKTTPKLKSVTTEMTKTQAASVKLTNAFNTMKTVAAGALTVLAGFEVLKSSFQSIAENGLTAGNVLSTLVGSIVAVSGAVVVLNAVFAAFGITLMANPIFLIGAVIAGVAIAIGTLIAGLASANSSTEQVNETYKNFEETLKSVKQSQDDLIESMNRDYEIKLAQMEDGKLYIDQLYELIDANGRVKSGYEDVANVLINKINDAYGTELQLQDGVIVNGNNVIKNKQDMIAVTDEYAEKLKKQILLEQYQEYLNEVRKNRNKIESDFAKVVDAANKEVEKTGYISEATQKKVDKAKSERLRATLEVQKAEEGLNTVTQQYAKGTADSMKKAVDEITNSTTKSADKAYTEYKKNLDKVQKETEKTNQKARDEFSKAAAEMNRTYGTFNPTIKFQSSFDSRGLTNGVNSWIRRNANVFGAASISVPTAKLAQGGLPSVGQMFIANERGPELVGQIGGQSFVANQNQMLDIIDRKLSSAGGLQNATFVIQVGSREVAREVLTDLQGMAKSNGKPITISG